MRTLVTLAVLLQCATFMMFASDAAAFEIKKEQITFPKSVFKKMIKTKHGQTAKGGARRAQLNNNATATCEAMTLGLGVAMKNPSCGGAWGPVVSNVSAGLDVEMGAVMNIAAASCGECLDGIMGAINITFVKQHSHDDTCEFIGTAYTLLGAMCAPNMAAPSGGACPVRVMEVMDQVDALFESTGLRPRLPSQRDVHDVCTCMPRIMGAVTDMVAAENMTNPLELTGVDLKVMGPLCARSRGQYCLPGLLQQISASSPQDSIPSGRYLCSACGRQMSRLVTDEAGDESPGNGAAPFNAADASKLMCGKSGGTACYDYLFDPTQGASAGLAVAAAQLSCLMPPNATTCCDVLHSMTANMGCCATGFLKMMSGDADFMDLSHMASSCPRSVTLDMCRSSGKKSMKAHLTGVNYTAVVATEAKKQSFIDAFTTDVSNTAGIAKEFVNVTALRQGSVIVDYELTADSDDALDEVADSINAAVGAGTMSFDATAQVALEDGALAPGAAMTSECAEGDTACAESRDAEFEDAASAMSMSVATLAAALLAVASLL
jgi:hypothetical protein